MTDPETPLPDCLFCKIVRREIPADIVSETAEALAFKDINAAAPTHILVIPKEHVASLAETGTQGDQFLNGIFDLLRSVAEAASLESGYRVVTNVGQDGGQTVPHLHFHLLGGRSLSWPPG